MSQKKRTPQEQLHALDVRLGVGVGAKRERARLHALLAVNTVVQDGAKPPHKRKTA